MEKISGKKKQTKEECIELCMKVLRSMNCNVERDDEDTEILNFKYQGNYFAIFCGSDFIRICFLSWHEIDLNDIGKMAKARHIINELNYKNPTPCISYNIDAEEQKMYINSSVDTVFIKEIPRLDNLLEYYFDDFYETAHEFKVRMATEEKAE